MPVQDKSGAFYPVAENLRETGLNDADFSRKQNSLCRGNQRFRGKNAEGLLGLPRFSLFHDGLSAGMLLLCNNFTKLPGLPKKDGYGENIRRLARVNHQRAELTFRHNLGMHVKA